MAKYSRTILVGGALAASAIASLIACSSPSASSGAAPTGASKDNGGSQTGGGPSGSPGATPPAGGPTSTDGGGGGRTPRLHIFPPTDLYSGFDGTHTYQVPLGAAIRGKTQIEWKVSDDSIASVATAPGAGPPPGPGGGGAPDDFTESDVVVTTKKAGKVTITATAGTVTASTTLTVTAYTADQYTAGENRYTKGGGGDPACFSCHFPDGGVDHSPSYTAEWDDQGIVQIFTTGTREDGSKLRTPKHNWSVTDAEKVGLVAYLRALPIPPPTDQY